jgi:cytoskeletal protein CcmA (bactofilin family)
MAVGRITGPLLKSNLIRNGIDLAFETDLLYLKVDDQRLGIKTITPQYELDVNGTTQTTNLIVSNRADIADITIENNSITTANPILNIATLDTVVALNKLRVDSIDIEGNSIVTNESNADLDITPNAAGEVNVNSNMNVDGNIHATGNITADGNITLGDADTDNVVFNAEVASDIIPDLHDTYALGSDPDTGGKSWNDVWVKNLNAVSLETEFVDVNGIDLALTPGNTFYVSENGDDSRTGDHPQDPFATVKFALSQATAGDTVNIYPGVYTEEFPLTVPAGVTVKGQGLRAVKILPTVATQNNDAFLLNGETTVEDITIADFFSPGYAFKFAPGFTVSSRSPYVKNITVITAGSTTTVEDPRGFNAGDAGKGVLVDGSVATANSREAAMLFHSATFITPGVDALTATNGARIEWLNSFSYFANRSVYAYDGVAGLKGDGKTRIRLSGISGTAPGAGQTVTFTSTDSSTVVGPLNIESVENSDTLIIDGKNTDLIGFDTTPASIDFSGTGTATTIENVDVRDFGAEIRMIGSASVYGNFGLVGDGAGVLVYAIGHNLAYIGNGKEVTNDPGTVVQANEVIETNDAQIRYNSVDHKGDFRVGDLFYVNQEDGTVDFAVTDFTINTTDGVTFNTDGNTTFIDGNKIETGDWRISGNTIETLTQDANFTAAGGDINLNSNVNLTGNLDVTGNVTIGGNITIGDEATDTIQIVAGIDSDILPSQDSVYSLGTSSKQWSNLYVNEVVVDDITIRDNFITTTTSNADLELRANGTGEIVVPSNNVQIDNNLNVDGTTTLSDTVITGSLALTGDFANTGNFSLTGNLTVDQELSVGAKAQFEEILIDDNFITTTTSNTNLELRANGTGTVLIPNNNVQINNDLTVNGTTNTANIVSTGLITSDSFTTGSILIDNNTIETTAGQLILKTNGTGDISVPSSNFRVTGNLTVDGATDLDDTTVNGTITHIGNTTQTGNFTITGVYSNNDLEIHGNVIETTSTNSNLELRAAGTGIINIPTNDVTFSQALTVSGATSLQDTTITGTVTHTGDYNQTGNFTIGGEITNGNILIEDNFIATTASNADLEFRAAGTGEVLIPNNDVRITNNLFVNGDATLGDTTLTGNVNITGDVTQTGDYTITSDVTVGGDLTVTRSAQFEEILIDDNYITTTTSNADLELRANGTGTVLIPNNNVSITNDLNVTGTISAANISSTGTITANRFSTGDILIDDNFITTTLSNSNLELRANGTGEILVPSNNVQIDNDLTVSGTTDLQDTNIAGTVTHNGDYNQTGNSTIIGNVIVSQDLDITGAAQFEEILIDDNFITTTTSNADLELRANGTGKVLIPNNNVEITNDLTVTGTISVANVNSTGTITANNFSTGDILIDDNFITTTTSNSDLELRAAGTGAIIIDDLTINNSTISSATDITLTPATGLVKINSTGSITLPSGTTAERPTAVAGQIRFNSELSRFEGYNGTNWIVLHGVEDLDGDTNITAELTEGANDNTIRFTVAGNTVADITEDRLSVEKLIVDDIQVDGNVISTVTNDTDLEFTANGTGSVVIDNFAIKDNEITNTVSDSITTFTNINNGYVKFDGTYGMVLPAGTTSERPPGANSELGMTRFNTTDGRMEVYDGANWVSVAGAGAGISRSDAENLAFEIVLSLG